MKVSCLCVTELRPEFWRWLLWGYCRQTYKDRELIVVAGPEDSLEIPENESVFVVRAPEGTRVSQKRNMALEVARGPVVAWFDDDDWQHPRRLERIVQGIERGATAVGGRQSWFLDVAGNKCEPYEAAGGIVFNGAGFDRDVMKGIWFDHWRRRGSDTVWMREVLRRAKNKVEIVEDLYLSFWLCHDRNLSNPARMKRFTHSVDEIRRSVGRAAWKDSDQQLQALKRRLGISGEKVDLAPRIIITPSKQEAAKSRVLETAGRSISKPITPVSALVKVTVLDTPWLDVLIPHMFEQAQFPFSERLIVIDRKLEFTGKYATRTRSTPEQLNNVIERLKSAGHIDRVVNVDYTAARVEEVMERYFNAPDVPTHASTGGPIYPTLFGLEEASQDHVVQYDADVFFWTNGTSWVEQSLQAMKQDPSLWLMMTHAGPIGPLRDPSIGERNRRLAVWDSKLTLWKFRNATTRYFLCDRRQLRNRIPVVWRGDACAPLEVCLGAMLSAVNAFRGNLADGSSWHLHAWSHESPFPELAKSLAEAISEGRFPPEQLGSYDLRLDLPGRDRWMKVLQNKPWRRVSALRDSSERFNALHSPSRDDDTIGGHRPPLQRTQFTAPIGVVIPVRDRTADWLIPTLNSLAWQKAGRPEQVILVSHGSQPKINHGLMNLCADRPWLKLIQFGNPSEAWNKSRTLNIGIRATAEHLPYLMILDADVILAPEFFQVTLDEFEQDPNSLLMCQISDLPQSARVPRDSEELLRSFKKLQRGSQLRGRKGTGAMQAAPRPFFFHIQGYDEDFLWWGAMDTDIVNRANACGLRIAWLEEQTSMLHQWHLRKNRILRNRKFADEAAQQWRINHEMLRKRSDTIIRNPRGWGDAAERQPR